MCCLNEDTVRTFCRGSAKLTHCLKCNTFGFQIGTAYFVVQPKEIEGLLEWLLEIRRGQSVHCEPQETLYLQISQSRIMLALSVEELENFWRILQKSSQWTNGSVLPVAQVLSHAVH